MRISRRSSVVLHDLLMIAAAWELAWLVRFNFSFPETVYSQANLHSLPLVVLVQGLVAWYFGLYRGLWRFASIPDLWNIIRAALLGVLAVSLGLFIVFRLVDFPRSLFVLYPVFLVMLLGTPRLAYRLWKDHTLDLKNLAPGARVLVIGAGQAGETLVRHMRRDRSHVPVGFVDDKRRLHGSRIHGLAVVGGLDDLPRACAELQPDFLVIAIPSASSQQMRRLVSACEQAGVPFRTLPAVDNLAGGASFAAELRPVAIDDLLGRDHVQLDWQAISRGLAGRRILVTGGGGSIGAELCRQIARLGPSRLVILERSEHNLFIIERELRARHPQVQVSTRLGDVSDARCLRDLFAAESPDMVFHAAAYKHVPLLQYQVREAVRNNIFGTRCIAEAALAAGVGEFVLISTDKAVNPTSIMGLSKRVAEMVCTNMNGAGVTRFMTVRFGNVLDSAGSVVPLFREQIARGGPVTVTHPEVTRYFMTIPEACQLIMQSAVLGEGGEIFVLDMGEPVAIRYLAEQMIRLSGRVPGQDIELLYTGLRPGEKLFEELFHDDERSDTTGHEKIRLARQRSIDRQWLGEQLAALQAACDAGDAEVMERLLRNMVPEYSSGAAPQAGRAQVVTLSTEKTRERQ